MSASTGTDPVYTSIASYTDPGETQAGSASTSTARDVQPVSDTSSSDSNRTDP